jgi:hypothetical protein
MHYDKICVATANVLHNFFYGRPLTKIVFNEHRGRTIFIKIALLQETRFSAIRVLETVFIFIYNKLVVVTT